MNRYKFLEGVERARGIGVEMRRAVLMRQSRKYAKDAELYAGWGAVYGGEDVFLVVSQCRDDRADVWVYTPRAFHEDGIGPFLLLYSHGGYEFRMDGVVA